MVAFLCLIYCLILYIIFEICFGPIVMSRTRVGLMHEFLSALLRPHVTHQTFTYRNDAVCQPSYLAFQVYCGYTHDTVTLLPWVWGGDGGHMHYSIMSYVAVWRVICKSYHSSNLNFSVLTLSMSLRYFGNELYN